MMPWSAVDRYMSLRGHRVPAALLLGNVLLIGHLAGGISLGVALALAATAVAVAVGHGSGNDRAIGTVETCLRITAVGGLGMLLGLVFDAGPFGVLGLIALCNADHVAAPGLDAVLRHVYYMPAASVGMVAGCILTTPAHCFTRARVRRLPAARCGLHLLSNVGMLGGMLYAESLSQGVFPTSNGSLLVAVTLISMLAGMFVGTLFTLWLTGGIVKLLLRLAQTRVPRESLRSEPGILARTRVGRG